MHHPEDGTKSPKKVVRTQFAEDPEEGKDGYSSQAYSSQGTPSVGGAKSGKGSMSVEVQEKRSKRQSRKAHVSAITKEDFKQWTKSCGVFKIQREYELIAADARDKGITIEAEMKEQGFKDYNAFARSCERFPLCCPPGDLAELGCGFVLHFQFLRFLAILLVVIGIVQIPALIYYAQHDNLVQWTNWENTESWYTSVTPWQTGRTDTNITKLLETNDTNAEDFLNKWYLTPGNLGPEQGDNHIVLLGYLVLTPILCLCFACQFQHQESTEAWVDSDCTSPNDFAVIVKGLPPTATDEQQIMQFFRQHATSNHRTEIVKVVIGWDANDFRERINTIAELKDQLKKLKDGDPRHEELINRIANLNDEMISGAAQKTESLMCSGTVVVVFRYQTDMRACLQRWTGLSVRWRYRASTDGAALPKFQSDGWAEKDYKAEYCLEIARAPNPGDINWMKLGVSWGTRLAKITKTNLMMFAMICMSFGVVYCLETVQDYYRDLSRQEKIGSGSWMKVKAISLLPGFGISIVNMFLAAVARNFGEQEYHDTHTGKEFSVALKMIIGMVINTSVVLTFYFYQDCSEWYVKGGLADDVTWVILADGVFVHFLYFFDIAWVFQGCERRRVTKAKLANWTRGITANTPPTTKEHLEKLKLIKEEIQTCKLAFEPDESDNAERFASAINSFLVCLIFTPVIPWLPLLGLLGLFVQYRIDMFFLLRWQKRPRPQNSSLAKMSLKLIKHVAPTFWAMSVFYHLRPSWENSNTSLGFFSVISLIISVTFTIVPNSFLKGILCCSCCPGCGSRKWTLKLADESFDDYYNAQHMWPKEMKYHKDQFLYKCLPDEKNPEMLHPDQDASLKVDALKSTLGTALAHAAEWGDNPPVISMRGGQTIMGGWANYDQHFGGLSRSGYGAPMQSGYGAPYASGPSPPGWGQTTTPATYGSPTVAAPSQGVMYAPKASPPPVYGASHPGSYAAVAAGYPAAQGGQGTVAGARPTGHGSAVPVPGYGAAPGAPPKPYVYTAGPGDGVQPAATGWHGGSSGAPAPQPAPTALGAYGSTHPGYGSPATSQPAPKAYQWPAADSEPPVWEFESRGGFESFAWSCQGALESQYQAFKAGSGSTCVSVDIGGSPVSVDFAKMTQKAPRGKVRQLRRRATDKE